MNPIKKELESRRIEIRKELELLFKANIKFTDWNIPEVNDRDVANELLKIIKEEIEKIQKDINSGKYDNY